MSKSKDSGRGQESLHPVKFIGPLGIQRPAQAQKKSQQQTVAYDFKNSDHISTPSLHNAARYHQEKFIALMVSPPLPSSPAAEEKVQLLVLMRKIHTHISD